jgi:hypothetical protein
MGELYGQGWARAICDELGCGHYLSGSFSRAMARAALVADSTNLAAIGQGFPDLTYALRMWQEIGADYLMALAAGDEGAMESAYLDRQDELVAAHDRQLDGVEV